MADDFTADRDTIGTVTLGGSVTGEIESAGDRDWFAFTVEAGKTYQFDLKGSGTQNGRFGSLADPYLYGIYDADGNAVGGTVDDNGGWGGNARVQFTPTESGTYYVAAGGVGNLVGTYTLRARVFEDDLPAWINTAGTVEVGGTVTGTIDFNGDKDWFAVSLEAGKSYRIDLKGTQSNSGTLSDPHLRGIFDASGNLIANTADDDNGPGTDSHVDFNPAATGTYYIAAGNYRTTGTYRLSVTEADDFTADTSTAGTVAVGGSVTGTIHSASDQDWFAVTLGAGKSYQIDLEGSDTNAGTLGDPNILGIYDASGNLLSGINDDNGGLGDNSRIRFEPATAGTYYIAAGAAASGGASGASGSNTGSYRLAVTELSDDFTADTATTGTVAAGSPATGEIEAPNDQDWFAVTLEAGTRYRVDLEGTATGAGTLGDPHLRGIYDASGNLIAGTADNNSGTGYNSRVFFEPASAGTYYVAAGAVGGTTGTYRLSVTEEGDAHTANIGTAGTVAVGGTTTGEIDYTDDQDWFAVTLEGGMRYRIDLEGSATGAGTLRDPYLRGIYNASGNPIAGTDDDDGGTGYNSRALFQPATGGTYYIAATGSGSNTGTYRLSVTEADDFTANIATAGAVAVGGSATGNIDFTGDRDWFAVTLEAGTRYRIDLEGSDTNAGTLNDPNILGIYDASGNLLTGINDDNGGLGDNSRIRFEPPTAGTYYIAAGASGSNTGTGSYRLSVTDDDFTADIGTAGTVAVGGTATGEIETSDDRDWFAVTLEAGVRYRIDLEGSDTNAGTLSDPYLRGIYDAAGNTVAGGIDDNGGTGHNSRVFFEPATAGTYYISAGGPGNGTGTYRLGVTELGDDFAADTGTTGTITAINPATGEIETPNDQDWFEVALVAGTRYRFDLEGAATNAATLGDPNIHGIYDTNGNLVPGTADNNSGVGFNSRVFFEPETGGTYYVAASAVGGTTGTYLLTMMEVDDAHTANIGTAGTVTVGGAATGEVDYTNDQDWFAVTLEAGTRYRIDLEGSATGAGTLRDPYLRGIFDASGNLIAGTDDDNDGTGRNSRAYFTPETGGTHYIAAGAAGVNIGTYRVSVTESEDDYADNTATTGRIGESGLVTGEIEIPIDRDWIAVTLEAGIQYRIDLEGTTTNAGTLRDPYIHGIFDASGNLISGTENDNGGEGLNSRIEFQPATAGTYYIAAGAGSDGSRTGTYRLSVRDVNTPADERGDDYTANTATTGTVAVDGSSTGEIEVADDVDWFAVTLEAGKTYRVDLQGTYTNSGTLYDPNLLGIYDASGALVLGTGDDDGGPGFSSLDFFTPGSTATYYIAAASTRDETGTYRLSVTNVSDDDYTADTNTDGAITVGTPATGEIETPNDTDWLAVTLDAGKTYRVDLEGTHTGAGTLRDPELLGIYDANGNLIEGTVDDNGGLGYDSRITFVPTAAGTYYVAASSGEGNNAIDIGRGTGTYRISVREEADDYLASTATTGTIAVGGSATGEVEVGGDRDWFAVQLDAGRTYRIDLEGSRTNAGTLLSPEIYGIRDANGNPIPGTTDIRGGYRAESQVQFEPGTSGTYYIVAGGLGTGDSGTGTYRLSVTEEGDDYTADTETTGTVAVGGTVTGGVDFVNDQDWIAVTLEAGTSYQFDIEGSATGAGTLNSPIIWGVHDANGQQVTINGWHTNRALFQPGNTGTYYIVAGSRDHGIGTYRLSVAESGDDYTTNTGTTGTVAVGGSATGTIESDNDQDWFAVQLEAGMTYRIDLEGSATGGGTLRDPYLRGIHDANGYPIAGTTDDDGGTGRNSRVDFTPETSGTYYIAAGAYNALHTGTYRLSVTSTIPAPTDDHAADTSTTGRIEVGGSVTGDITRNDDFDWFAVTLEGGKRYQVDFEGADTNAGTLGNPYIRGIYDASGTLIQGTNDRSGVTGDGGFGLNSRVEFQPETTGTYYISAVGWGPSTGTYRISVKEFGAGDDYAADTDTTGTVTVGSSTEGTLEDAYDRDWFAVQFEAGTRYRVDLEGRPTDAGTLPDPYLHGIYYANGNLIAGTTNDDGGTGYNSRVEFTPGTAGTYYIAAGAYGQRTGTYELSVEEVL